MIYIDTSCLLKLLRDEPESADVRNAIQQEEKVIISSLTELEAEIQLQGAMMAGEIRSSQLRQYQARLIAMRNLDPFHFRYLPAAVFSTALRQHRHAQAVYCRTLDRLHLAAMVELNTGRLMTLDQVQGKVASSLGFQVLSPGGN
jgi:predicted nucleic acid-binding protein